MFACVWVGASVHATAAMAVSARARVRELRIEDARVMRRSLGVRSQVSRFEAPARTLRRRAASLGTTVDLLKGQIRRKLEARNSQMPRRVRCHRPITEAHT